MASSVAAPRRAQPKWMEFKLALYEIRTKCYDDNCPDDIITRYLCRDVYTSLEEKKPFFRGPSQFTADLIVPREDISPRAASMEYDFIESAHFQYVFFGQRRRVNPTQWHGFHFAYFDESWRFLNVYDTADAEFGLSLINMTHLLL